MLNVSILQYFNKKRASTQHLWLVRFPIEWTKNSLVNFAWKHSNFKLQENFISMWYIIFVCICANIVRTVKIKNEKASHIPILNYLIIYIVFTVKILIPCWAIWTFFKDGKYHTTSNLPSWVSIQMRQMWKRIQNEIVTYTSQLCETWTNWYSIIEIKKWKLKIENRFMQWANKVLKKLIVIQDHTLRAHGHPTSPLIQEIDENIRLPTLQLPSIE